MALLKGKVRASTLLETIVATVLILVIFAISSLVINSVFINGLKGNPSQVRDRMNFLEYELINGKIELPYSEDFGPWEIRLMADGQNGHIIEVRADKKGTGQVITTKRYYEK